MVVRLDIAMTLRVPRPVKSHGNDRPRTTGLRCGMQRREKGGNGDDARRVG